MLAASIVGKYRAQWGEGPLWHKGHLYYVDIESHQVIRYNPLTDEEKIWPVGQRVGTVVACASGGLVCAGDDGFFFLDEVTGDVTPIHDPEPDKPDNRFNDGKCSPDGYFFAGTISLVKKTGDAKLYRLAPDLSVDIAFSPVTNSNGITWSADGKTCYYIDTPRKAVLAFDYCAGTLTNPREVISTAHIESSPDGMAIDADDNVWIAFCHGGCVILFSTVTGAELQKISLPCVETTACAFGGDELRDLYITTGVHKSITEPDAGRLWVVKDLPTAGAATHLFAR